MVVLGVLQHFERLSVFFSLVKSHNSDGTVAARHDICVLAFEQLGKTVHKYSMCDNYVANVSQPFLHI